MKREKTKTVAGRFVISKSKYRKKELIEVLRAELSKCFEMGLRQSPTDAENSEFYRPLIDLTIAPKLADDILASHPEPSVMLREEEICERPSFEPYYISEDGKIDHLESQLKQGYPKEFVEWKDKTVRYYNSLTKIYWMSESVKYTLDELYQYFLDNVKGK